MQPLSTFPNDIARNITCVFTDIDDTLTNDGRLPANAYAALEALQKAGIYVAAITGRPAGWCDLIARMWPVAGVVGENGAFYFSYDDARKKMLRVYEIEAAARAANQQKLAHIQARVLAEVPGSAVSADQPYREADLAIDFCEDVPPLPAASVQRIVEIFEEEGAVAKVSSIHVNGWFGQYDKLSMSHRFAAERLGINLKTERNRVVFCGDSPNDSPMFSYFPYACGVANVADFAGKMDANPAFIATARGGDGFVEIANKLLSARANGINASLTKGDRNL
ncbi:MAG TPA: HAD family phosphatase [Rhodobacteraceae bacterium]|nr:HAD family phosphatase [Paracoccaceae bacterium]